MATNNDIIHAQQFNHLVANYTGLSPDVLQSLDYNIEVIDRRELKGTELAIQTVRLARPPKRKGKDVVLAKTTFLILYPPAQEEKIDNNDFYARRTFPNYFYLVEEKEKSGKCEFREMTSEGPRHGMASVTLLDFATATKLVGRIGEEIYGLAGRLKHARALIAQGEQAVKQAHLDFHKIKQEHIDAADISKSSKGRE